MGGSEPARSDRREGHDAGHRRRHVAAEAAERAVATSCTDARRGIALPETTMLGLAGWIPARLGSKRASNTACRKIAGDLFAVLDRMRSVHQHFRLDDRDEAASWQSAAYRASACAFALTQARLGSRRRCGSRPAILRSARHDPVFRDPIAEPSSPSVMVSPGARARGRAGIDLIPGRMPRPARTWASGVPVELFCLIVSSCMITPLIKVGASGAVKSSPDTCAGSARWSGSRGRRTAWSRCPASRRRLGCPWRRRSKSSRCSRCPDSSFHSPFGAARRGGQVSQPLQPVTLAQRMQPVRGIGGSAPAVRTPRVRPSRLRLGAPQGPRQTLRRPQGRKAAELSLSPRARAVRLRESRRPHRRFRT